MLPFIYKVVPVIDYSVCDLCREPYYNHPKGCPNFGNKISCPPIAPLFDVVFDISKPSFAIVNVFDLENHVYKMKKKHPNWSERQLKCVLYWQHTARKELRKKVNLFKTIYSQYSVTTCPEGMGIDVLETMKQANILMEWTPKQNAYQIALAAIERQNKSKL